MDAAQLNGKVVLFVNVASKCGFTQQYDGLQELYKQYKDQGLVIVGVPCNQFGNQEPGKAAEIKSFCRINYGVDFPLLEKQDVNGKNRSELYNSLVHSSVGKGKRILWNFEKFIVDRKGNVTHRFRSVSSPQGGEITSAIQQLL